MDRDRRAWPALLIPPAGLVILFYAAGLFGRCLADITHVVFGAFVED